MSKNRLSASNGLKGHDGVATQPSAEEEVSVSTITIGVELAKCAGHVQRRQDLRHEAFVLWLAQVPAGTMEACSGAHHWARRRLDYGCNRG
jgi:hypothetical protein